MIFLGKIRPALTLVTVIWIVFLIDYILPVDLRQFGIAPREISSLPGILFAPFLHINIVHIISNSVALFILTLVLLLFYERSALQAWLGIALLGGGMVWLAAPGNSVHIGASGVIYGLIAYLIASGIYRKTFKSILIGGVIFIIYGGVFWGVLPTQPSVSWEGHLFGAIAGAIMASITKSRWHSNV